MKTNYKETVKEYFEPLVWVYKLLRNFIKTMLKINSGGSNK